MFWGTIIPKALKCNLDPSLDHDSPTLSFKKLFCDLLSFSGTEIQLGPIRQQALPGPGEDREEQQERGPDQSQNTRLERGHGTCRGLL